MAERRCFEVAGVSCQSNETWDLDEGYWRHSEMTEQVWLCKEYAASNHNKWSPCRGGTDAGFEGDGYCSEGYHGPRCELCVSTNQTKYFDRWEGSCYDCGHIWTRVAILVSAVLISCLAVFGGRAILQRSSFWRARQRWITTKLYATRRVWTDAGMRYKVKSLIGLFQCTAAVPGVFGVVPPRGLEEYTRWIYLLELPANFDNILLKVACLGGYRIQLWLASTWPIFVLVSIAVAAVVWELSQGRLPIADTSSFFATTSSSFISRRREQVLKGLTSVFPLALVLSFLMAPSTSTRILKTFLCFSIEYDGGDIRRYLQDDLTLRCDTVDYEAARDTAIFFCALWPVGVPLSYALLVWASRDALLTGTPTALSRSTSFLSGDYTRSAYWWESLEMCRTLMLTGGVLFIHEESEIARLLVALLLSIGFLTLRLSIRPLKRPEDLALQMLVDLLLITVYTCALVIKTCEMSEAVCASLGFGDDVKGVYLFFVFFILSVIGLHLCFGAVHIWTTGNVPKFILLAKSHSVSPATIFRKVLARRYHKIKLRLLRKLRLDGPHLTPSLAAAILQFRTVGRPTPSRIQNAPPEMMMVLTGEMAEIRLSGIFPRTTAFTVVDLETLTLRWTSKHFILLSTIESVVPMVHAPRPIQRASQSSKAIQGRRTSGSTPTQQAKRKASAIAKLMGQASAEEAESNRKPSGRQFMRRMSGTSHGHATGKHGFVAIWYLDYMQVSRVLELHMPHEKALKFAESLKALLLSIRGIGSPAHSRWAMSCMGTSERGATGYERLSELRGILRRANANPTLKADVVHAALEHVRENEKLLPAWLRSSKDQTKTLNARHVTGVLVELSTASDTLTEIFTRYSEVAFRNSAFGRLMSMDNWLDFQREEQMTAPEAEGGEQDSSRVQRALSRAEEAFNSAANRVIETSFVSLRHTITCSSTRSDQEAEPVLNAQQFALLILSRDNNAVAPARELDGEAELDQPFAHYWASASHNSYIVGDQITGLSDANMYRRLLLQGLRHLEIDCWDGTKGPVVTHGHTFTTSEAFEEVARAIADTAFTTSDLPVTLSLEMHCSPDQQRKLARMLSLHLSKSLLMYDDLVELEEELDGEEQKLSPSQLKGRVLLKGKVRHAAPMSVPSGGSSNWPRAGSSWLPDAMMSRSSYGPRTSEGRVEGSFSRTRRNCGSRNTMRGSVVGAQLWPGRLSVSRRGSEDGGQLTTHPGSRPGSRPVSMAGTSRGSMRSGSSATRDSVNEAPDAVDEATKAYAEMSASQQQRHEPTDLFYSSCICCRSEPLAKVLAPMSMGRNQSPLPFASINEDRLLSAMGLSRAERNQIEGLSQNSFQDQVLVGGTDEQRSSRAVSALAANPPEGTRTLQQRTAQHACLNFSNIDLAVQLHFALFDGSDGYVLKPGEMLRAGSENETGETDGEAENEFWPPMRHSLHRASIGVISLHNLPKRGEVRPGYDGKHGECHQHFPEKLSGRMIKPTGTDPSCPSLTLSLFAIGGGCAVVSKLPVPHHGLETEMKILPPRNNGMNATFDAMVHCLASEPLETFLRVSVVDRGQEVAYETAVLGRLREGLRVFQLRGKHGTRIELCFLLVRISFGSEPNILISPRQARMLNSTLHEHLLERNKASGGHMTAHQSRGPETSREVLASLLQRANELAPADLLLYEGFEETCARILFPYSDRLAHLAGEQPCLLTIRPDGSEQGKIAKLNLGLKWTPQSVEQDLKDLDQDAVVDELTKHPDLLKMGKEALLQMKHKDLMALAMQELVGKPRNPAQHESALMTFAFPQSIHAKAAAKHLGAPPNNLFVWRRADKTIALAQCWRTRYNSSFKKGFKCTEENPDEQIFSPLAVSEFRQAMRNLLGPDADKVPLVYAYMVKQNNHPVLVGTRKVLLDYLESESNIFVRHAMGIIDVSAEGFKTNVVVKGEVKDIKWFSIPAVGQHALYVKEGYETLACTKAFNIFAAECKLGKRSNK